MRNSIKLLIHKCIRKFGIDIISIKNIEEEIARREKERENSRLRKIRELREERRTIAARSNKGEIIWVGRDQLESEVSRHIREKKIVLDIGCAFHPQQFIDARTHICCEPFYEYMDRLIEETKHDPRYVYLNCDFSAVAEIFPEHSIDTLFMVDVIEHIDREIGIRGIEQLKKIVRSQIILFTPIGFMEQDPHDDADQWGMGGVEWQKHRSGWVPEDFPVDEGWTVVASKDFHQVDGYGRELEEPFGAFWAIWNAT